MISKCEDVRQAVNFKNKKTFILLNDYKFDDGAIKVIAEKKKACFLIDVSRIIKSTGTRRAVEISMLRNFLRLCIKHGAIYALVNLSEREEDKRTDDELIHIGMLLGLSRGQGKKALQILEGYDE